MDSKKQKWIISQKKINAFIEINTKRLVVQNKKPSVLNPDLFTLAPASSKADQPEKPPTMETLDPQTPSPSSSSSSSYTVSYSKTPNPSVQNQNPSPMPPSLTRLWRPAAQRNLRNQWSKLVSCRKQWVSSSSSGKSHATSLVNAHLSQRYPFFYFSFLFFFWVLVQHSFLWCGYFVVLRFVFGFGCYVLFVCWENVGVWFWVLIFWLKIQLEPLNLTVFNSAF